MDINQLDTLQVENKKIELIEEYTFSSHDLMLKVLGPGSEHTQSISKQLGVKIGLRGDTLLFRGDPEPVGCAIRLIEQLSRVCRGNKVLKEADVTRGARILAENPSAELNSIFNDVVHVTSQRRLITPKGWAQKQYVDTIRNTDLTFAVGPAGTGKTYLAVAVAVSELLAGRYKRIVLTRPAVEAGEKLGFLPGDMVEKINPYVRPLYDALNDMMDSGRTQDLVALGQIEIAPLAFMRGRTLNDSFVILDEAQNTTRAQMKMFLTRLGYSSKAVVTGDATQVDLPHNSVSGLVDAQRVLAKVEGIGFCHFTDVDVVRHELVQQIILAYEKTEAACHNKPADGKNVNGEHDSK